MLALTDAVIFCTMSVLALGLMLAVFPTPTAEFSRTAPDILDALLSSQVRMSDLVNGGDGSLVRVSDLCALHAISPDPGTEAYLKELLDMFSAGRGYGMTIEYGGGMAVFGEMPREPLTAAVREVPVSTGGSVRVALGLWNS